MAPRAILLLPVVLALWSCSRHEVLTVRILPDHYEVAGLRSVLATPAVDETVKRKPGMVHMYTCLSTPAGKVLQFQTELAARFQGKMGLSFLEQSECPS